MTFAGEVKCFPSILNIPLEVDQDPDPVITGLPVGRPPPHPMSCATLSNYQCSLLSLL